MHLDADVQIKLSLSLDYKLLQVKVNKQHLMKFDKKQNQAYVRADLPKSYTSLCIHIDKGMNAHRVLCIWKQCLGNKIHPNIYLVHKLLCKRLYVFT